MSPNPNSNEPPELSADEQARWDTTVAAGRGASAAFQTGDTAGFEAAPEAFRQAGKNVEGDRVREAVHVPKDAGEHADALRAMLHPIPGSRRN
jgi:hypothetical protein